MSQQLSGSIAAIHAGLAFRFGEDAHGISVLPERAPLEEFGAEELPNDILALARDNIAKKKATFIGNIVQGDGQLATRLRNALSTKRGPEPDDPESMMRDKLTRIVSNNFNRSLALDLKTAANGKKPQFNSDIQRFSAIRLKGVGPLDRKNLAKAYDQFAQLVTKNPAAKYDLLDPKAKRKADIAMAFTTQSLGNAMIFGVGTLLHPDGNKTAFSAMGGNITMTFDVDISENGSLEVKFTRHHKPSFVSFGDMESIPCGPGSEIKFEVSVTAFENELDRIAKLDFRNYDDGQVKQFVEVEHGQDCYERARWQMPEVFRLNVDVAVKWSADLK